MLFYAFGFFFLAFESLKNLYTHGILPRFSKSDASLHPYIKILGDVFLEVGFAIVLLSLLITILQTHQCHKTAMTYLKEFFRESRQDTQLNELRANEESSYQFTYQFTYNMR